MNQVLTIAKKELKGYFLSPVALIFLGTFLLVVMFSFFWIDTFFKRDIADVRPLFHWLPVLLIFLVSALTMRLWSEEQRMGTLEILLTLPIKVHRLVLGKFLAGLVLVAIALALTLSLPITVNMLGDLDWGPVFGGYLGSLLVAAAYLSIGLCISSSTSNPIVALMLTMVAGGSLYLVGSDAVASFSGNEMAELLHSLGIGSRFESIQRGVIDLRDLLYYGSLCVGFLFLNTVILEAKKWSQGENTRMLRVATKLSAVLVVANLLVLNVGFAAVRTARLDLTERGEYSISPVTKKLIAGLEAPLLIRGYFSSKTHKLLTPLVPRIRDMIEEYGAVGGDKIVTEIIDPYKNPAAEKEANEDYGIKSIPFQFADRHEAAVVNSYFHILVKYGDKYETLSFNDLIEAKVTGMKSIEVKLRNLEYDLTRAIKKVVYGFQPLESVFARITGKVELNAYITPKTLPKNFEEIPNKLQKIAGEITARSSGKFVYKTVDPSGPTHKELRRTLFKKYGLKPLAVSFLSEDSFYLHLLIQAGDRIGRIPLAPNMSEADMRNELTAALKRLAPGFLKTLGLLVTETPKPPQNPMMRQRQPPGPTYRLLQNQLSQEYSVKRVDLKDGRIPGDVDVLLVAGPENLDEKQRYAIDQFLMRGGPVVIATGRFALNAAARGGLEVKKTTSKLEKMLKQWGVSIKSQLVLDPQNEAFPMPVQRNVMGLTVREVRMLNYPFWVDIRSTGMAEGNPIVSGLPSLTLQWSSPLKITKKEGLEAAILLKSTDKAWTQKDINIQPDFDKFPQEGFGPPDKAKRKAHPLAVALSGTFVSTFKDKPSPLLKDQKGETDAKALDKKTTKADGRTIEKSPKDGRLVVIGSSNFLRDDVLNISRHSGSDRFINSLQFVQNLIDWSVADVDLLSIRSRGTYARTLKPLEDSAQSSYEFVNYVIVLAALLAIVGLTYVRRRNLKPMALVSAKKMKRSEV